MKRMCVRARRLTSAAEPSSCTEAASSTCRGSDGSPNLLRKAMTSGRSISTPGDRPVVAPMEPRVEAGAEIDDQTVAIRRQEGADFAVDGCGPPWLAAGPGSPETFPIVGDSVVEAFPLSVPERAGPGPALLDPVVARNQQRLRNALQVVRINRRERVCLSDADDELYRDLRRKAHSRGVAAWSYCLTPHPVHLVLMRQNT
jgi:hypothetical protein